MNEPFVCVNGQAITGKINCSADPAASSCNYFHPVRCVQLIAFNKALYFDKSFFEVWKLSYMKLH